MGPLKGGNSQYNMFAGWDAVPRANAWTQNQYQATLTLVTTEGAHIYGFVMTGLTGADGFMTPLFNIVRIAHVNCCMV